MHIVMTTIRQPTFAARKLAEGIQSLNGTLWVVGDRKGPETFDLTHTKFFHIDEQRRMGFTLAEVLPEKHYTRKNLGYLAAIREGADCIVETDDDNFPRAEFFDSRQRTVQARQTTSVNGWCNIYKAFTVLHIWPRGLPLESIHSSCPKLGPMIQQATNKQDAIRSVESFIQQGLADENPDVDAIYRLTLPLPFNFEKAPPVSLTAGVWCPFNSQNTTFFKEAFPLLYLPSFCSFRMTDIWRSFVAQRCLWEMDSTVTFHAATVWQERNDHNLLRDFEDEISGYLNNEKIRTILGPLNLQSGRQTSVVCDNLITCYSALVEAGIVASKEMKLVELWCKDISKVHE